jgi:SsrA-binding protein
MSKEQGQKYIARNRRALHDYTIEDTYEAGLVLTGTEVKSLRQGRASLTDGFAEINNGEAWLHNVHIPEYTEGTWTNHAPRRIRKLLLHRSEIERLLSKTTEQGLTLVPLSLYFKDGHVKAEIALARGKRTYDKRQDLAKRDAAREMDRALRRRRLRCPHLPILRAQRPQAHRAHRARAQRSPADRPRAELPRVLARPGRPARVRARAVTPGRGRSVPVSARREIASRRSSSSSSG